MIKLGIVMDPISSINVKKDSSIAMLLEAQKRGYEIHYMEMQSLYLRGNKARASTRLLSLKLNNDNWYNLDDSKDIALSELSMILMRKDPPLDTEFIYATYILEFAEREGVLVINKPQSLRDCNEKIFTTWFPHHIPDILITRNKKQIQNFLKQHYDVIIKPLNGMGGMSVFRIMQKDPNLSVIIETLTHYGQKYCMVQNYLTAIQNGDKRILVINGNPIPYCLARIPKRYETRANLAAGGYGEVRPLSETDWKIVYDVAPILKKKGLIFVGLDIIGDKLTEINITSPTCVCEIEAQSSVSITGIMMDEIERLLN